METNEVIDFLMSLNDYGAFVSGKKGKLCFTIYEVEVVIFREEIGANYYYRQPCDEKKPYCKVCEFMKIAIPYLSKKIENHRDEDFVSGCDNVRKSFLK